MFHTQNTRFVLHVHTSHPIPCSVSFVFSTLRDIVIQMILFNGLMAIYGQQSEEMAQFQSWLDFEVALTAADPGISTKAAIGSFSTFCTNLCHECSIQGICGASDEDMCLTFGRRTAEIGPRATSVLRCRLKKCLMFLVPDAQHRWPNFWHQKTLLRLMTDASQK